MNQNIFSHILNIKNKTLPKIKIISTYDHLYHLYDTTHSETLGNVFSLSLDSLGSKHFSNMDHNWIVKIQP